MFGLPQSDFSFATICSILPLFLSFAIAAVDLKTRRIPNYLTFGCAMAGLGLQLGYHGLPGLMTGLGGLALGLALLLLPYLLGGMGAGDVKALAALGAWLGPWLTLCLFIYMGISGLVVVIVALWWRGQFIAGMRQGWLFLSNWLLGGGSGIESRTSASPPAREIPYAAALALGMLVLYWRGG